MRNSDARSSLLKVMLLIRTVVDDSHSLCWALTDSLTLTLTPMPGMQNRKLLLTISDKGLARRARALARDNGACCCFGDKAA